MAEFKVYSNIVNKESLREVQKKTLDVITDSLINSFGPSGTFTAYREEKNIAKYTKDGHTILSKLMFNGAIEFTMRDDLEAITRRIVTTVGDGTTSAIILSAAIFKGLCEASEKFHISDKQLVSDLKKAIDEMCIIINNRKEDPTIDDIYNIAMISTDNDEYIANLIKDIYTEYGMEVFIDVSVANGPETVTREYDGFTINSGLADIAFINNSQKHVCDIKSPKLYLFEDPIDTVETSVFMEKIIHDNIMNPLNTKKIENVVPTVIVCPKIGRDINTAMDELIRFMSSMDENRRSLVPITIVTNINDLNYIMDLSYISGAKLIKKYIDPEMQKADQERGLAPTLDTIHEFAGSCDEVVVDSTKSKFINPGLMFDENGELSDLYKNRLKDMEEQLKDLQETKEDTTSIGRLKKRINSYKANQVEIFVGGISETDRDSRRDLLEDAVLNCRSAALDGFGYGANFEGLHAINALLAMEQQDMSKEDVDLISSGNKYSIYQMILSAYVVLYSLLYRDLYKDGKKIDAYEVIARSIISGCPLNIRTLEYDKKVLSSIKTDVIILDAIAKIIGTVFTTNQFLVSSVPYNTYIDIDTKKNSDDSKVVE